MDKHSATGAIDQRNAAQICTQPVYEVRACRATRPKSCRFLRSGRFPGNLQYRGLFRKVIIVRSDGRITYVDKL